MHSSSSHLRVLFIVISLRLYSLLRRIPVVHNDNGLVILYTTKEHLSRGMVGRTAERKGKRGCKTVRLLLDVNFAFLEDKVFADDTFPNIVDIIDDSLKVRCGVVGAGDENIVSFAVARRSVQRFDLDKSGTHVSRWEWEIC